MRDHRRILTKTILQNSETLFHPLFVEESSQLFKKIYFVEGSSNTTWLISLFDFICLWISHFFIKEDNNGLSKKYQVKITNAERNRICNGIWGGNNEAPMWKYD